MYTILVVLVAVILFGFPAGCQMVLHDVNLGKCGGEAEMLEHTPVTFSPALDLEVDVIAFPRVTATGSCACDPRE
jgi:hypothetical protein